MISRIGRPDHTDTCIHKYRPATRDGVHDERPECNYGGYHVWVTDNPKEVTCPNCMEKELTLAKPVV
jgi:hypothetical protein